MRERSGFAVVSDYDVATPALAGLYAEHLRILEQRLERALAHGRFDGLVIDAGTERTIHRDDAVYPFHAEPYFAAWLPLTRHPGCLLKLAPGRRPLLIYLQSEDFWFAPAAAPAGFWVEHFEVRCVPDRAAAMRELGDELSRYAAIGEDVPSAGRFAAVNDPLLLATLDYERAWKTGYEIACMAQASSIGVTGHEAARAAFAPGVTEFELNEIFCRATGQRETELPYLSIVALNEHAAVLHYQHLEHSAAQPLRSFLIDAGARCHGYASDITRTWSQEAGAFQDLIAAMETAQQTLCSRVRPGVDFVALNAEAHRLLAGVLHQHGLIRCSAEQAYEQGITRTFLPHGLGHLLGLQVHDAGGRQIAASGALRPPPAEHPFLRLTRTLETGFVLTIEPGLYFIPSLLASLAASEAGRAVNWAAVEALVPYGGIRIEDNVLVTADAARNLTREAWRAVAEGAA